MALGATIHRVTLALSDVDRGVYETLELRLARHPSESTRFLVTRMLAYALAYQDGIAFSKAGIADTDEPPIAVRDPTGLLLAWIDVGSPAPERLHKAAKAAREVAVYGTTEPTALRARAGDVHRASEIALVRLPSAVVEWIEERMDRSTALEVVRTEGHLYVTIDGDAIDGAIVTTMLA
jgi:uncharacterized protein YaeQ